LCAPVGSVIVGDRAFISEARRIRKLLGGGMRQAGVIAAAGRIAIHDMVDRLSEDHANACALAQGLADVPHLRLDIDRVVTNFVFFDLLDSAPVTPAEFAQRLWDDYRIKLSPYPGFERTYRAVTHYWITPERVAQVSKAIREILT
jgi:threonine aldolase